MLAQRSPLPEPFFNAILHPKQQLNTHTAVDLSSGHHTIRHHFNFYSACFRNVLQGTEILMYLIHLSTIEIQKHDYAVQSFSLTSSLF